MARTVVERSVTTKNARRNLPVRVAPYYRDLGNGVHIGYKKRRWPGVWLIRYGKPYRTATLATADDVLDADGESVLDFEQAKKAAIRWIAARRTEERASVGGPVPTVRKAVESYIEAQERRERERQSRGLQQRLRRDARLRLSRNVLESTIADLPLHALTEDDLAGWQSNLRARLAEASVRRIRNDVRALLNAAAKKYRKSLPADFALVVKHGLAAEEAVAAVARDTAALPDADIRSLLEHAAAEDAEAGWDGDLFRLVAVLASSGARFSQVIRMTVADVQLAQSRLAVPTSLKGRGTKRRTHVTVPVGSDVIQLLRPAIAGRRGNEPLFERWRHKQVKAERGRPPRWVRSARGPWLGASELQRPWLAIIKRAGLSADVTPYSLRHSSIVRQLRAGLPVRLVAAAHDTSSKVIETHYSGAVVDLLDDLMAGTVISLLPQPAGDDQPHGDDNIVALRTA